MTETPPEQPAAYAWLDPALTSTWLQLDADSPLGDVAEWCRKASARFCQRQRPDLLATDPDTGVVTFDASEDVIMAGLIGAARLYSRRSTPAGLASFGDYGTSVLRLDPDVARLLGTGRHARPMVG